MSIHIQICIKFFWIKFIVPNIVYSFILWPSPLTRVETAVFRIEVGTNHTGGREALRFQSNSFLVVILVSVSFTIKHWESGSKTFFGEILLQGRQSFKPIHPNLKTCQPTHNPKSSKTTTAFVPPVLDQAGLPLGTPPKWGTSGVGDKHPQIWWRSIPNTPTDLQAPPRVGPAFRFLCWVAAHAISY